MISLIVAVYKNIDFLELVLMSISRQTFTDFEVIVAEDNQDLKMQAFLKRIRKRYTFPIVHVSQPDQGFRKNKILNRAIVAAKNEYLVFIDGDCILHPMFLAEYAKRIGPGFCFFGRRVRLDQSVTEKLIETADFKLLSLWRLLFTKTKRLEDGLYLPFFTPRKAKNILGCNFGVTKTDMKAINGFDEDFENPLYGEDTDVRRRLQLFGVRLISMKFKAIQYHLYHPVGDRSDNWKVNGELFRRKQREGLSFCKNGLVKKSGEI